MTHEAYNPRDGGWKPSAIINLMIPVPTTPIESGPTNYEVAMRHIDKSLLIANNIYRGFKLYEDPFNLGQAGSSLLFSFVKEDTALWLPQPPGHDIERLIKDHYREKRDIILHRHHLKDVKADEMKQRLVPLIHAAALIVGDYFEVTEEENLASSEKNKMFENTKAACLPDTEEYRRLSGLITA